MPEHESSPAQNVRARLLIAGGALVALVVLVVVVVLGGGEGDREFAAAPSECVLRWNRSPEAKATGAHNSLQHNYFRVQVAYGLADGSEVAAEPVDGGGCVVVFGASQLDPEPFAAAEINEGRSWTPLSAETDTTRLAELQSAALEEYNAELAADGTITPLD